MPEYKWQIFFVAGLASITTALAISSLNIAMPIMAEEFGVSMSAISRLSLVYALIPSCTLLIFGRMGDLFGYKRQFIAGFLLFGLSSFLLPIIATGLMGAIIFRCVQGIGSAMMISITQALCNKTFPPSERGKALGINAVFVSIGLSLGPSVGGLLLSYFSWRSIFFFNAPFSLLGVVTTILILKKDTQASVSARHMDWFGSLFFAIFIGLLTLAINFSAEWGFESIRFIICIIIGLAFLLLFIYRERRIDMPLMNLAFFRNRTFLCANIASFCSYAIQQITTFLVPFFMLDIQLISRSSTGSILLISPISMMLFSPIGGKLADRFGSRKPALMGFVFLSVGCIIMSVMTEATPVLVLLFSLLLYGAGNGFCAPSINSAIFSAVPREESGMASGMVATVRNLGQAIGVAFAGTIMAMRQNFYFARLAEEGQGSSDSNSIYLLAQRDTYFFCLLIVAAAIVCIAMIPARNTRSG